MKRSLIIFGIVFLLVISIAYAGVLNYYGKIEGIANVQPPLFITDYSNISSGWKRLNINTFPEAIGEVSFTDTNAFVFHTDALGITSFYPAHWKFHVTAKVNSPPQTLYLELWEVDPNGGSIKSKKCEANVTLDSTDYKTYTATCTLGEISLNPSYGLGYRLMGAGGPSVIYTIEVGKKECKKIGWEEVCYNIPTTLIEVIPQD
jgi:hypothetical protein